MRKETIHCDGPNCTKIKTEVNKWLIGQAVDAPSVRAWGYAIGPWNDHVAEYCHHFCGITCALAKQNEFLEAKQ